MRKPNFRTKLFILKNLTMPKTVKGGSWRFFDIHFVAKKNKGGPFGDFEKFSKKPKKINSPLGFFNIRSVAKYQKKLKGGPFGELKNFRKKVTKPKRGESHSVEKVKPASESL